MRITLTNDFHGTSAVVVTRDNRISARQMARAESKLCGIAGCTCGGVRGKANPGLEPISPDGDYMLIEPPARGRPVEMTGGKRVNVYLDAASLATAERIGNGNVSAGIRAALSTRDEK